MKVYEKFLFFIKFTYYFRMLNFNMSIKEVRRGNIHTYIYRKALTNTKYLIHKYNLTRKQTNIQQTYTIY